MTLIIPRPLQGICDSCQCPWSGSHGEPNRQQDYCSPPTLRGCLCHSEAFATAVYEGDRGEAA